MSIKKACNPNWGGARLELAAPGLKKIITNGTRRYDAKKEVG